LPSAPAPVGAVSPGYPALGTSLTGGSPGPPVVESWLTTAPNPGGGWLAGAGGYWMDHPACVPIIVRVGNRQQEVHIGLGTLCPGQQPPQGLSQR
jgi:hypothetical protein